MTRWLFALCMIPSLAHADERFHEIMPALRIEANISTVSSMTMNDQGVITDNGTPVDTQPTITVEEADGPTQDGVMIFVKTIRGDF